MKLFGSPTSSPISFLKDLENLSPKSSQPFETKLSQPFETQSSQSFEAKSSQPQEPPQPKPMLFHPIYKDIHGPLYGEPNFQHHDQPPPQESQSQSQSQSQHFESFSPSYEETEVSL